MKRFILALTLICALLAPSVSSAYNGMYMTPKLVMAFQNTGTVEHSAALSGLGLDRYSQFTLGAALAAGFDFWPMYMVPLRAELELAVRGNSENEEDGAYGSAKLTTNSTTLLANFYYDFHNSTQFTPYVGAGIGAAFNYVGVDVQYGDLGGSVDDHVTNLAWQVGVGCSYAFDERISLDVAYRYLDLGYTELSEYGTSVGLRPFNHEFTLGVRCGF